MPVLGPLGPQPRLLSGPVLNWGYQAAHERLWASRGFFSQRLPATSCWAAEQQLEAARERRLAASPWVEDALGRLAQQFEERAAASWLSFGELPAAARALQETAFLVAAVALTLLCIVVPLAPLGEHSTWWCAYRLEGAVVQACRCDVHGWLPASLSRLALPYCAAAPTTLSCHLPACLPACSPAGACAAAGTPAASAAHPPAGTAGPGGRRGSTAAAAAASADGFQPAASSQGAALSRKAGSAAMSRHAAAPSTSSAGRAGSAGSAWWSQPAQQVGQTVWQTAAQAAAAAAPAARQGCK